MRLFAFDILKYKVIKIIFVIFFSYYNTSTESAEIRPFLNSQMCTKNYSVNDCSHQFNIPKRNSCVIYKTEDCRNKKFLPWNLLPVNKLTQEAKSDFTITILPYYYNAYDKQDTSSKVELVSAVNILLTSFNKNISGYSIIMTDELVARNAVCRIIDFRNVKNNFDIPFTFAFDCFQLLREKLWKYVTLSFIAYPLNTELSYYVYFPSVTNSTSPCVWEPLVMLFQGSLPERHIQMKFSNVPSNMKFLFFLVSLTDSSNTVVESRRLPSTDKSDMIYTDFQSVAGGYYSVSIDIILDHESCSVYKSDLFLVGPELKDFSAVLFTILLITIVMSGFGLLYFARRLYLKSVLPPGPTILFMYFHKQPEHDFLVTYAKYLKKHFNVNDVFTLYKRGVNARDWLDQIFSESDTIVYVLSEGFFKNYDNKDTSIIPDSCYIEQFSEAKILIDNSLLGSKTICKVCFPYSGVEHLPESLKKGELFMLLDEQDKFLHFIFNSSAKCRLLNWLCCVKYHRRFSSNGIKEDNERLRKELKNITENHINNLSCNDGIDDKDRKGKTYEAQSSRKSFKETYRRDLNLTPTEVLSISSDVENVTEEDVLVGNVEETYEEQCSQKSFKETFRRDFNLTPTEVLSISDIENVTEEDVLVGNVIQPDSSIEKDNFYCESTDEHVQIAANEDITQLRNERNEFMRVCLKKTANCEKY